MIVEAQTLADAADDVAAIGSPISKANATAAGPTTAVATAAEDEISEAVAAAFNNYAQGYHAVITRAAAAVNDGFAQAFTAASTAYAEAEAAARSLLGQSPIGSAATAAANVELVMGPSGLPLPPPSFVSAVTSLYIQPNFPVSIAQVLYTGGQAIQLPTQGPTMTTYYMIPTQNLPLLDPLRAIPVVGNPLADLMQPDLKVIVNLGYGNPDFGYSTGPANIPTQFGLFPNVNPITVLRDLAAGVPQGIHQAMSDLGSTSLAGPALPNLSGPTAVNPLTATTTLATDLVNSLSIGNLQTATTTISNALTGAATNGISVLLPTADIALVLGATLPTYDFHLFLGGLQTAINGNPVGLVDAIGLPIAADTGLVPLALFIEGESVLETAGISVGNSP